MNGDLETPVNRDALLENFAAEFLTETGWRLTWK